LPVKTASGAAASLVQQPPQASGVMDELLHHCLRELSFDGDLGEFRNMASYSWEEGSNPLRASVDLSLSAHHISN
jgi:hypothetical protein